MKLSKRIGNLIDEGQEAFRDLIRKELYFHDENIFNKIDYYNDHLYSDPLLYAYFSNKHLHPNFSPERILVNYLADTSDLKFNSDKNSLIYISGQGYYQTDKPNSTFLFSDLNYKNNSKSKSASFYPKCTLQDSEIEIYRTIHKLLRPFFNSWGKSVAIKTTTGFTSDNYKQINNAFNIIKDCEPIFYHQCISTTKKILLFRNKDIPGFVTRRAHGVIFLSHCDRNSIPFFIEEIVHQCGHNIFNAITFSIKDHIKISPNTPLRNIINRENITNTTIEGAYHGVFTVCVVIQLMASILHSGIISEEDRHEFIGRLGAYKRRFKVWTQDLELNKYFTDLGIEIINELERAAQRILDRYPYYFDNYDFSNQPYVFSYDKFIQINPVSF